VLQLQAVSIAPRIKVMIVAAFGQRWNAHALMNSMHESRVAAL